MTPKRSHLKQQSDHLIISVGQESGSILAGWFQLKATQGVSVRPWVRVVVPKDSTGAGESAELTHVAVGRL